MVHTNIVVEFWMERRNQLIALSCGNDVSADLSKNLSVTFHLINIRRSDECHRDVLTNAVHLVLRIEAAKLTTISIATYVNVHSGNTVERLSFHLLCQKDKSGTCAEYGKSVTYVVSDGLEQAQVLQKLQLHSTLASRNHKTVLGLIPVRQLANLEGFGSKTLQHHLVLNEGTL